MNSRLTSRSDLCEDETREEFPMMGGRQLLSADAGHRHMADSDDIPGILQKYQQQQRGHRSRRVAWYALLLLCCISLFAVSEILLSRFFTDPLHLAPKLPQQTPSSVPQTPEPEPEHGIRLKQSEQLDLKTGFVKSGSPTTREYTFNITLGRGAPDGFSKSVIFINGQSPGPLIEANTGDTLHVVVNNFMPEASTTIHWHGIDQRNSSWMDGVHGVTQCGIPPGESFTYEFSLAGQRGTFWYHSHVSVQYAEGLYGPLIIHDPDETIPAVDDDKIVMFGDLFHQDTQQLANQYLGTYHPWSPMAGMEPPPNNIIINGHHVSNCSEYPDKRDPGPAGVISDIARNCTAGSLHTTSVKTGHRVRLRLISHSASTPFWFSIDNHTLAIAEVDGNEVEPIVTTRVFVNPGQRYSVLVKANQTAGNYRMRATAVLDCFHLPGRDSSDLARINFEGIAILSYEGVKPEAGITGAGWNLHSMTNSVFGLEPWIEDCSDLPFHVPKPLRKVAAYEVGERNQHYISFERFILDGKIRSKMNQTIYQPLKKDATIWRALELDTPLQNIKAEDPNWDLGSDQLVLISRDTGKGAEIVVNSLAMMMHPFHLHGQSFQVVGWGEDKFGEGETTWNLENPMRRDTLTIPGFSHVVLRIRGDNPGIWAFHCHIVWHAEDGMFVSIGQRLGELGTMLKGLDGSGSSQGYRRKFCSVGR